MMHVYKAISYFCILHPAFLFGVSFLLGTYAAFYPPSYLVLPAVCLWSPLVILPIRKENSNYRLLAANMIFFLLAWGYTSFFYTDLELPPKGINGKAHISIESISYQITQFSKKWKYECTIKNFFSKDDQLLYQSIPCTIILKEVEGLSRPLADQEYLINGQLIKNSHGRIELNPSKEWHLVQDSWSLAEWRFQFKQKIKTWIQSRFSRPSTAALLTGLITGEFEDLTFRQLFSRFGLQHILAISGFHFNLFAGVCSLLLRCILSRRMMGLCIIISMSLYAFMLGKNPSVMRAWIMICLPLMGSYFEKKANSLNLLGVSLLCLLAFEPAFALSLTFQLSFMVTGAILLAYHPAQKIVYRIFPKQTLAQVIKMPSWDQHGYCILSLFREGMTLSLAVNLFALPLSLFYFQQFQWMGIIYNFFFPALISISFSLFFLGFLFQFIPHLEGLIHEINQKFSETALMTLYHFPETLDMTLSEVYLPIEWLLAYLSILFMGLLFWHGSNEIKSCQGP